MSYASILAGLCGFLLFGIYDVNSVVLKKKWLKPTFFSGLMLVVLATVMMFAAGWEPNETGRGRQAVFLILAAVFLMLLIYTLFFALPFEETYIRETELPAVYSKGVYALCRHPGVLWFVGMYACFAAAMPTDLMIGGGLVFSLCNILYVVMQDLWTFPHCFCDYSDYKKHVPFLIPTVQSGKNCIKTMKVGRKHI